MNSKAKYPDFFDQRCIVWTNINLFNGFDYEALRGHCCVCQDTQIVRALKLNNDALDEIRELMNVEVEQPIISIDMHYDADDEAMSDCYIFPYCNLNGCFCFSGDGIKEWYIDEKDDLRSFEVTDIDSCFSLFRMLKPSLSPRDVQHFKEEIIAGNINWDMVEKYTDSIGEKVATAMFGDVNDEDSNNE